MANNISISQLSELLLSIDNILIMAHERPDGDAFGSVTALLNLLRSLGKKADAFFPEKISENYKSYLCDGFYIETPPSQFNYSYCVSLDCSNLKRLAIIQDRENEIFAIPLINIDHHSDNGLYGSYNYIDPLSSSSAEIIYDIIKCSEKWVVSPAAATAVTLGILTDTGGLRFDNTSSNVLKKISDLINMGADYINTVKSLYFKKSFDLYLLEADIAVNHLKTALNKRFAYFYLSEELLNSHNLTNRDTEGLIDTVRIIDGIDIAAVFTKKNNGFKVSLRSNSTSYSVADIAHKLDGGGHKLAAGCFIDTNNIIEAEKIMLSYVTEMIN